MVFTTPTHFLEYIGLLMPHHYRRKESRIKFSLLLNSPSDTLPYNLRELNPNLAASATLDDEDMTYDEVTYGVTDLRAVTAAANVPAVTAPRGAVMLYSWPTCSPSLGSPCGSTSTG
jgi:hypothetical protein